MESWGQVCSGVAALALLAGSGAGLAALHLANERAALTKNLLASVWRAGVLVGVGALVTSVVLRCVTVEAPMSTLGDRAAVVALVAGLLSAGVRWRQLFSANLPPDGWVGLILITIVAGISALRWPVEYNAAPFLLLCNLLAAGLGLWAAGQRLDALTDDANPFCCATEVAFAALTLTILVVGAVNWRVWGTPGGLAVRPASSHAGLLGLLAVWLISVAGLILQRRTPRFAAALTLLAAALLVGIALSAQWVLPFS